MENVTHIENYQETPENTTFQNYEERSQQCVYSTGAEQTESIKNTIAEEVSPPQNKAPSRGVHNHYEDITFQNNVSIGGTLRAKRIVHPWGALFVDYNSLITEYPLPYPGMWAIVGTTYPFDVYRCREAGKWELIKQSNIGSLIEEYIANLNFATQEWVKSQGYLTGLQDLSDFLSKSEAKKLYQPKGDYLTHQAIHALTMAAGKFAAGSYNPAAGAASVNVPTHTSHLTNDSDYTTNAALNAAVSNLNKAIDNKLDREEFEELFVKVLMSSGKTAIRAKFALYSNDWMSALGANPDGGTGTGGGMDETALEAYLTQYGYATQQWVRSQGYLIGHQDISHLLSKTLAAATYLSKTDAASTYLSKTDAAAQYQPKGNYLTQHRTIYALTMAAGRFAAGSYNPAAGAASVNVPTHTSHLTNDSDYTTGAALNAAVSNLNKAIDSKLDRSEFEELLEKVILTSGKTAIRAKYALYSNDWMSALGANPDGGTGTGGGMDETALEAYLTQYGYATQQWVRSQGYLIGHQDISHLLSKTLAAATYLSKTDAAQTYLSKTDAAALYQPKGSYLTTTAAASTYLSKTDAQALYQPKGNYLTSHQALDHISYIDRRSTNLAPYATGQYLGVEYQLKSNSADGLNDGQSYHGVLNLHAWRDSSAGAAHQMAFTDNGNVWLRHGREAWAAWRRLAFVGDIAWANVTGKPNLVTLDTVQTISAVKTFSQSVRVEYDLFFKNLARENGIYIYFRHDSDTLQFAHHKNYAWQKSIGTLDINGNMTMASFIKVGGTSAQFLKADGSVDSTAYVNKAGDTMTGALTIQTGGDTKLLFNNTDGEKYTIISFRENGTEYANIIGQADKFAFSKHIKAPYFNASETTLCPNLNADLLDGFHAATLIGNMAYNYTSGCRVTLDAAANSNSMITVRILGNSYQGGTRPIDTTIQLYNYQSGNSMLATAVMHNGHNFGAVEVFNYGGKVCLWFKQDSNFQSFIVRAYITNTGTQIGMAIADAPMPTSGVTRHISVSPKVAAMRTDNVASATRLQGTYSLWGQSFYGNNVSGNMTGVGSITAIADSSYDVGTASNQFKWGYFHGIYAKVGSWLGLGANNTDHIRIDTNGNVGIGTTDPAHKLDVAGDIHASGWLRTTGNNGWYNQKYGGGFYMIDSTWVRTYNNGNLYSGTGQIRSDLNFTREGYGGASWDNGYGAYNVAITNNGAQTPLMVAYRAGQQPNATGANRLFAMELLNTGTNLRFSFGGTLCCQMVSDGSFYAKKGAYSDGYMSALGQNTGSDIRLKTWLADVALPLGVIASAPAWIFRWRPEVGVMAGRIDAGTTAQYWQQWLPQVVSQRKDKYLQIDYAKTALLSAIMIARYMRDFTSETDRRIMELEATCRRQAEEIKRLNMIIKDMERRLTA